MTWAAQKSPECHVIAAPAFGSTGAGGRFRVQLSVSHWDIRGGRPDLHDRCCPPWLRSPDCEEQGIEAGYHRRGELDRSAAVVLKPVGRRSQVVAVGRIKLIHDQTGDAQT